MSTLVREKARGTVAHRYLLLSVMFVLSVPVTFAQRTEFDILKGNDVVGKILATRSTSGERTLYLMTSYSEFDIVAKQVVRSTMAAEYSGSVLSMCHLNMYINGSMRDSSHMVHRSGRGDCYVHPKKRFLHEGAVEWTTARMYFEEPVDQPSIFVESVLKHCPLVRTGAGKYRLDLPGAKSNHYAYEDGILREIRVDRALFDLVFKRT